MVGGRQVYYINQPIEILAQLAAKSIEANEGVWFGCEVSKRFAAKQGIEDLQVYVNFPLSRMLINEPIL